MRVPDLVHFGRRLPPLVDADPSPDWKQADARWIRGALQHNLALPGGGWVVLDATRRFGSAPRRMRIAGRDWVIWRGRERLHAAADACPHLGASLAEGTLADGCLVCPWHGLRLDPEAPEASGLRPTPTHDDGVLLWMRVPGLDTTQTPGPQLPPRPRIALDGVIRMEAFCEPRDVLQNRLDPWHGVHYHPHSFGKLDVLERLPDEITVRVSYKVLGRLAMEVDARFHCPNPRSIVMTIVAGDGRDSVVETHATPLDEGRTAIVEATLATSDRPGFHHSLRFASLLRPLIERRAARLWVEDAHYAERLYALRHGLGHTAERTATEAPSRTLNGR